MSPLSLSFRRIVYPFISRPIPDLYHPLSVDWEHLRVYQCDQTDETYLTPSVGIAKRSTSMLCTNSAEGNSGPTAVIDSAKSWS